MPINALLGAVCYTQSVQQDLQQQANVQGVTLDIHCLPSWYF